MRRCDRCSCRVYSRTAGYVVSLALNTTTLLLGCPEPPLGNYIPASGLLEGTHNKMHFKELPRITLDGVG